MARLVAVAVLFVLGVLFAVPVWPAARAEVTKAPVPLAQVTPKATASPTPRAAIENVGVATKTTINQEQLRQDNSQNTYDAIKAVPGVAQADAKAGGGADNLQIRGIHLASNTGYRLDGYMPMENNIIMSSEDKEQVQVLKGAGALEYGLTSPAGVVNYYLKRATKTPITTLSVQGTLYGQGIVSSDFGRRFELAGGQFGVRTNFAGGEMGSYVKGAGGTRYLQEVAADWTTKRALLQLDLESFGIDLIENATTLQNKAVNNVVTLPNIPDPTNLLSGTWARSLATGQNYASRGVYALSKLFTVQAELGHSEAARQQRFVPQLGTYNVTTGKGTETVTLIQDQQFVNTYQDFSLKADTKHRGWLNNEFMIGYTDSVRDFNNPTNGSASFKQNLYNPTPVPAPTMPAGPIGYNPQNDGDYDYYFHDQLNLEGRFHLIGGLRKINYWASDRVPTTGVTNGTNITAWAPGYGLIVDFTPHLSLYGDIVKSLQETGLAPANSKNAYSALPPAPATEDEVGLRTQYAGLSASLSYFFITLANATTDPVTNIFALNGTNSFSGLESKVNFDLGRQLSIAAGGQIGRAYQTSNDPTINGLRPENTPILSGSLGASYRPGFIQGLTLNGEMLATGPREVNPQNQGLISSVTVINTGFNYSIRNHGGGRYVVTVTCKNCTDKLYWTSAVNGALGVSSPRTVTLTFRAQQ